MTVIHWREVNLGKYLRTNLTLKYSSKTIAQSKVTTLFTVISLL